MKHPFRLKNAVLLMALAAVYPMVAHSAAGVAQFTAGDVNVRRGNAATPLVKGQPVESGDSIVTGGAGQAQLRFTDGGLVSLAPNTQFNITNYSDANDPGRDSFAVNLFRGGMRAITGLIGKRNRENYKVTTNTATIGIRGSAFSAKYNADGSLDVAGEQDAIAVCTNAGCVELTVGEIVRVSSSDSLPSRTSLRTNLPPLAVRNQVSPLLNQPEIVIDVEVDHEPPPPEGPVMVAGVSALFVASGADNYLFDYDLRGGPHPSTGQATFLTGEMILHSAPFGYEGNSELIVLQKVGDSVGSFGTVGTVDDPAFIGWGYWDMGQLAYTGASGIVSDDITELDNLHFIVGRPTPLAQMPQTGTAAYSLVGGTAPTAVYSSYDYETETSTYTRNVGQLVSAGLNVDFGSGKLAAVVNTQFMVDGSPVAVQISDFGDVSGSSFYSAFTLGSNGRFNGFFTGDQASRAGLIYEADDETVGYVSGAAVFVKGGGGQSIDAPLDLEAVYTSSDEDGADGSIFTYSPVSGFAVLVDNKLILQGESYYGDYCGSSVCMSATSPVTSSGGIGNARDADFIGWGYWAQGVERSYGGASNVAGVHYLVGRPTSNMPMDGVATYTMAGGTAPTATYNGTSIVGQLLGATLQVNFSNNQLDADVSTQFVKEGVTTSVSLFVPGASISGARFAGSGCGGTVSGIFTGDMATRAGMVYRQNAGSLGTVNGAVAFTRGAITLDD